MTQRQFDKLLKIQEYARAMCRTPFEQGQPVFIDHDHACCPDEKSSCGKCIRGLLDLSCNTALGHIEGKYALARAYLDNPPAQLAIRGDRAALPVLARDAGEFEHRPSRRHTCQTLVMATDEPGSETLGAYGFAPCFPVRDMRAALAHYEQLGFQVMAYTQGATWAWARLGPAELHLFVKDNHDPATTAAAADLEVADADEFSHALRQTAAGGTSDPYDTPYGREFVHVDPDNNLMRFVAPATPRR